MAITGETEAIVKYDAYSKKAKDEGLPNIAYLFDALVQAEQIHNRNHYNALKSVSEVQFTPTIPPKIHVGSTLQNLQDSIKGEQYESKNMYPDFIKEIRDELREENGRVAKLSFAWAEEVELGHADALKIALKALESGHDLDVQAIFVCRVCGNLVFNEPEEFCSVCGHDQRFFMKINRSGDEK